MEDGLRYDNKYKWYKFGKYPTMNSNFPCKSWCPLSLINTNPLKL